MTSSDDTLHATSAGFWLPCYRSSFFSRADDSRLLQSSYHFSPEQLGPFPTQEDLRLEVSIFTRLLMSMPRKGYTSAYPIFPGRGVRSMSIASAPDPLAVLFLARAFTGPGTDGLSDLAGIGAEAVSLVVHQDGYYVWTLVYSGRPREHEMQAALKKYIYAMVGAEFSSHHSGRESEKQTSEQVPEENLTRYRDNTLGILAFFQINTILEGMFNGNLDPRMFFQSNDEAAKEYSIGRFINYITAPFHPQKRSPVSPTATRTDEASSNRFEPTQSPADVQRQQVHPSIFEFFATYLRHNSSLDLDNVQRFALQCVYPPARAHILDEFLVQTEVITLKQMKKRIERCRRALIDEMIEVTHRRDPLVQAEPPDGWPDRIEDVTEAQLRGYVMLLSAKMPLVTNVLLHLKDIHYERETARASVRTSVAVSEAEAIDDPLAASSEVSGPYHSWANLLVGLEHDLRSLSEAINQARSDRMLYEQEQIHAEEETLAEIQRLSERTDSAISTAGSVAVSVISNLLALFAVVLAAGPLIHTGKITFNLTDILLIVKASNIPGELAVLAAVAALVIVYAVLYFVLERLLRAAYRQFRTDLRRDAKYYYEMDVHVDAPFLLDVLEVLFEKGLPGEDEKGRSNWFSKILTVPGTIGRRILRRDKPRPYRRVSRNSYRVERLEKSEALHKIYVEADIHVGRSRFIHAVLVYELLYHRPAKEHDFVFKDLRVVATHSAELLNSEIIEFKRVIAKCFVNPCLEVGWQLTLPEAGAQRDEASSVFDSFFTVTQLHAPA